MRIPRFYTAQTLVLHQPVVLEQAPSHHLLKVLRIQAGDSVLLFNGDGKEYQAILESSEGKRAILGISCATDRHRESRLRVSLGQGISRGERMDLVIQKAVELGVKEITPLWSRRSQVQLSGQRLDKRLSHWRGVIQAACEQSGRVRLPVLHQAVDLAEWLGAAAHGVLGIILDPEADTTLQEIEPASSVQVLVGPEGGLEHNEVGAAVAAGFRRVRLGPRILRTETAALAALAALQTLWGDFNR
jgi:16S rRNA (uracil1498-N3)-methyltransferase